MLLQFFACTCYLFIVKIQDLSEKQKIDEKYEQKRRHNLGIARFLGELFKLKVVSENILHECITRLLKSSADDSSLECAAVLFTTAGQHLDKQEAKVCC